MGHRRPKPREPVKRRRGDASQDGASAAGNEIGNHLLLPCQCPGMSDDHPSSRALSPTVLTIQRTRPAPKWLMASASARTESWEGTAKG